MAKVYQGVVQWFDKAKEEGEVATTNCETFYFHARQIKKDCKIKKGTLVYFVLYENLYMKQVDRLWT